MFEVILPQTWLIFYLYGPESFISTFWGRYLCNCGCGTTDSDSNNLTSCTTSSCLTTHSVILDSVIFQTDRTQNQSRNVWFCTSRVTISFSDLKFSVCCVTQNKYNYRLQNKEVKIKMPLIKILFFLLVSVSVIFRVSVNVSLVVVDVRMMFCASVRQTVVWTLIILKNQ